MHDLRDELEHLAPAPARPLDMAAVWRRGRRLRLRRIAAATTGAIVAATVLVAGGSQLAGLDNEPPQPAAPVPVERHGEVRDVARSLSAQVRRLEARVAHLKARAREVAAQRDHARPDELLRLDSRHRAIAARVDEMTRAQRIARRELERLLEELRR